MLLRLTKSSPCCVFLALISLARCQHAVLSSIIETLFLIRSSYRGWVHRQLTTSHFSLQTQTNKPQGADKCCYDWQNMTKSSPCCVFLALISLARCQHAVLSSIIETLFLIRSSDRGWVHKQLTTCHFSLQTQTNKPQGADKCCYDWQNMTKSSPCCVFLALISLARCQHRCSVLSLRCCFWLDHHIGAECTSS